MKLKEFEAKISDFLLYLKKEKGLAENTYRAYASDLQQFITFWETQPKIPTLKNALNEFRGYLLKQKAGKTTIARKLSCFNSYERFLASQGIKLNLGLIRPHLPQKNPESLSTQEIYYLLDELDIHKLPTQKPCRDKAILELLYATGIRCSELINIQIGDIDLEKRAIVIHGKRKKTRTVYFSEKAEKQLKLYLKNERKIPEKQSEFFFLNYRYQPLTSRSVQRICNMFGKFLKTKTITPHILRHSFAVHLLEQGADSKKVQELLGFSSPASIEKYLR